MQEIVDRTMLSEFEICRALYDLMSRNLIAPVATGPRANNEEAPEKSVDLGRYAAVIVYVLIAAVVMVILAIIQIARGPESRGELLAPLTQMIAALA